MNSGCRGVMLPLLLLLFASRVWAQGPPFQTDDPVPVDLHHYEFYVFGGMDGTPAETDATGPAVEFNWGAIPRVQLHAILPFGVIAPSNNPVYLPGGTGPSAFGLTDMELGAKLAIIKESKYVPQIGTFTMFDCAVGRLEAVFVHRSAQWLFLQNEQGDCSHAGLSRLEFYFVSNVKFVAEDVAVRIAVWIWIHPPNVRL